MIKYTDEQEQIIDSVKNEAGVFNITALAGTGKTTICLETMKALDKNKKMLYLVFNKAMQQEALQRLGKNYPNIEVKTTHAFAYQYCRNANLINGELNNIRPIHIKNFLDVSYPQAFALSELLKKYLYSGYPLSNDGIVEFIENDYEYSIANYHLPVNEALFYLKKTVRAILEAQLPMPHDFYLKYFATRIAPDISGYDLIVLDESQDTNPATMHMIKNLKVDKLMLVGDPYQRIYQFRQSVLAEKSFLNAKQLYLTQTFRFGDNLSHYANTVLSFLNSPVKIRAKKINEARKKEAIITRTNIELLMLYKELFKERKILFERDLSNIIKLPLTIALLYEQKPKEFLNGVVDNINQYIDPLILSLFKDFEQLSNYVIEKIRALEDSNNNQEKKKDDIMAQDDKDLIIAYSIITNELINLYDIIDIIKSYNMQAKTNYKEENILYLTTSHSSKGTEYENVYVKDSMALPSKALRQYLDNPSNEALSCEINLLYVALTRAGSNLVIEDKVKKTLEDMKLQMLQLT